ncbi:preprotein translocase subunit YajC [Labrys neptuniae]
MFTTPAFAQAAQGGGDLFSSLGGTLLLPIAMFVIFYFLLIRPQQRKAKEQAALLKAIRRGDTIVLSGGMVGKVTKAVEGESEIEAEIAEGVRVKVIREMVVSVRSKTEPVKKTEAA